MIDYFSYGTHSGIYLIVITVILLAVIIFSIWSKIKLQNLLYKILNFG
jgi:hypothetical protein